MVTIEKEMYAILMEVIEKKIEVRGQNLNGWMKKPLNN